MPTERVLAAEFGASRHLVRQVLERLEARGILWRHVGRGTFLGRRAAAAPDDLEAAIAHSTPREIVEGRRMLEPQIAALAAVNASKAQIDAIEAACRRCSAARNMDAYEVLDEAFHRAIADACGNGLVRTLFEVVNRSRKEIVWGAMRRAILNPERRAVFTGEHSRITEAISRRDADAAWEATQAHMATVAAVYATLQRGAPARQFHI